MQYAVEQSVDVAASAPVTPAPLATPAAPAPASAPASTSPSPSVPGAEPAKGEGALDRSVSSISSGDEPVGVVADLDSAMNELALTEQERAQVVSEGVTTVQELRRIAVLSGWTERATHWAATATDVVSAQAALDAFVAEHGSNAESWSPAWDPVALLLLGLCKGCRGCRCGQCTGEAWMPQHLMPLATDPTHAQIHCCFIYVVSAPIALAPCLIPAAWYLYCDNPGSQPRRHVLENALWEAELEADAEKAKREAHARIMAHRERHDCLPALGDCCGMPQCSDTTLSCCAGCCTTLPALALVASVHDIWLDMALHTAETIAFNSIMCVAMVPCVMCAGWLAPIDNRRRHFKHAARRANKRVSERLAAAALLATGEFHILILWFHFQTLSLDFILSLSLRPSLLELVYQPLRAHAW
jgi:hypothetical protein